MADPLARECITCGNTEVLDDCAHCAVCWSALWDQDERMWSCAEAIATASPIKRKYMAAFTLELARDNCYGDPIYAVASN